MIISNPWDLYSLDHDNDHTGTKAGSIKSFEIFYYISIAFIYFLILSFFLMFLIKNN